MTGTPVRIHRSRDVIGVEVAGAMSHVSALAVGMADGLGTGDNTRGTLMTRGMIELARLGNRLTSLDTVNGMIQM